MKAKLFLFLWALMAAAFVVPAVRADGLDVTITGDIRLGRRPPPPPPPLVVVVPDSEPSGPSPWERGRWYQRSHGYYYYPGGDVYYRPADRVWFYQERGQWRSGRNLPDYINVDFGRNVSLTMATDRPYLYHQQIVARYPSNYFGTRVRIRADDRHDRDYDAHTHNGDRDNERHGQDKDRN